jgi:hypothetical protein
METPENPDSQLTKRAPIPFAATIWEDQPDRFEQLRRRLARIAFPASASDVSEFALAHSPPLYTDQTGDLAVLDEEGYCNKVPRYVRFVDSFPMTVTGKVQKYLIRETLRPQLRLHEEEHAS